LTVGVLFHISSVISIPTIIGPRTRVRNGHSMLSDLNGLLSLKYNVP